MLTNRSGNPTHIAGWAMRHTRKRIYRTLKRLASADDAHLAAGWAALVAQVEAAFRQEERIMEALGYRGLRTRLADNACALRALHRVTPLVEAGQAALGRQVLAALQDILSLHRFTADLTLASELAHPAAPGRHPAARTWRRGWTGIGIGRAQGRLHRYWSGRTAPW